MKNVFEEEANLCRKMAKKNGGKCNWGKCKDCGVVPLLYKLFKDEFIDLPEEVTKVKKENGLVW